MSSKSYSGGISLIAKAGVLKTPSNRVKAMCGLESHYLLYVIELIMKKIILKILVTVVILVGNCLIWVWDSNCVNKQNYMDVSGIVYSKLDNPSTSYKSSKITSDFIMVIKMIMVICLI